MWSFLVDIFHLAHFPNLSTLQHMSEAHSFLWSISIPLHEDATFCLSICIAGHLGCFFFQLLGIMLLQLYPCMMFCVNITFSFLLIIYIGVEFLDHIVNLCLTVEEFQTVFQSSFTILHSLLVVYAGSDFFTCSSTLNYYLTFYFWPSQWIWFLFCISLRD